MKFILLTICFMFSATSSAENLNKNDLIGAWITNWPTTKDEVGTLEIRGDFSSSFKRTFKNNEIQDFISKSSMLNNTSDIWVLTFEKGSSIYKLALSGWKLSSSKRLFGTIYMYRNGVIFNGLPISFESSIVNKPLKIDTNNSVLQ